MSTCNELTGRQRIQVLIKSGAVKYIEQSLRPAPQMCTSPKTFCGYLNDYFQHGFQAMQIWLLLTTVHFYKLY